MDELSRLAQDLDPALTDAEKAELVAVGMRLQASRPLPAPAFRGDLKRHLFGRGTNGRAVAGIAGRAGARTTRRAEGLSVRNVKARIAASAGSGFGLLALAALGLVGAGPFAA